MRTFILMIICTVIGFYFGFHEMRMAVYEDVLETYQCQKSMP